MSGPSTSTSINGAAAQHRVDWAALRSYISQKEAYETQTGRPAPLNDAELSAIAILLRPADPDLGGQNWISLLNHFLQVRRQAVSFRDEARQEIRLGKAPELRWACFVAFDSTGDQFPQPGYGIGDGTPKSPDFSRKQDAKQYAAKSACEWLMATGHMLPSGTLPKFPKPFGPTAAAAPAAPAITSTASVPAKRSLPSSPPIEASGSTVKVKQETLPTRLTSVSPSPNDPTTSPKKKPPKAPKIEAASSPQSNPLAPSTSNSTSTSTSTTSSSAATPAAGVALTNPLDNPTKAPRNGDGDAEIPATKRVEALCKCLKFPVPHYNIKADASLGGDFWCGRPDFDNDPRVPDDLGVVKRVLTKKAARERIAEAVLDWMLEMFEQREAKARAMLGE